MGIITEAVVYNLKASIESCNSISNELDNLEACLGVAIRNPFMKPDNIKKVQKIKKEMLEIRDLCISTLSKENENL